jgi:hypothetical protein
VIAPNELVNPAAALWFEVLKFTNPTFPVMNTRTGPEVPPWNLGTSGACQRL